MGLATHIGVKSPFLSDLRLILTHIVVSKDSYWLILWCQKSISEWFETHIVVSKVHFWVIWESGKFGLKKGTGVDPPPPRADNVPFFYRFFYRRASLRTVLKKTSFRFKYERMTAWRRDVWDCSMSIPVSPLDFAPQLCPGEIFRSSRMYNPIHPSSW